MMVNYSMTTISYKFVELIPDQIENGILYISIKYCTAIHKCCCECGNEVVTPLSPTDWQLIFDGKSISLYPSIGNWNFTCRSHYWIRNNKIIWSEKWTEEEINAGRHQDSLNKMKYYGENSLQQNKEINTKHRELKSGKLETIKDCWVRLKKWWS